MAFLLLLCPLVLRLALSARFHYISYDIYLAPYSIG